MFKKQSPDCTPGKPDKLFPYLFGALILLHIITMWTPRIYPFTDVPNHLGLATIVRHYDEPENHFNQFYEIDTTLKPNTFHIYFTSLKLFPSVEFGNKIFYCLYVILLPLSMLFAIKKLGGNPWYALLSFLFLYNYNVSYGFVGFTIAIPFFIFLFALIPDHLQHNKIWPAAILTALFILLFFMHALTTLFALLVFFICTLYHNRYSCSSILKKTIIVLPVLILILLWWQEDSSQFDGPGLSHFILNYYTHNYFESILLRGGFFVLDNYALHEGLRGYVTAAGFSLFVVLVILLSMSSKKRTFAYITANHTVMYAVIFIICSLTCLFFIPLSLPGYNFLVQRFSVLVFLALILLGSSLCVKKITTPLKISIWCVALLHALCWYNYINDFNKENVSFSRNFFDPASSNTLLTGLIFDNQFRGRPIYKQCADYYIVWNKGIASTRLIDERSFSVRRKTGGYNIEPYIDYQDYKDIKKIEGVDYILVRGKIPDAIKKVFNNFTLKKSSGKWSLFKYIDMPAEAHLHNRPSRTMQAIQTKKNLNKDS